MSRFLAFALVIVTGMSLIACGQFSGFSTSSTPPASDATAGSSAGPSPAAEVEYDEESLDSGGGGAPKNIVQAKNNQDGRLRIAARIQLNTIKGDTVAPVNIAFALGDRCVECKTMAIALQLDVTTRNAHTVTPMNAAVAVNSMCTRCRTIARALQYVVPVDDPKQLPDNVKRLVGQMRKELTDISSSKTITLDAAEQRVNAVITQFTELALSLDDKRDEKTESDTPTPSPGLIPAESPSAAPSGSTSPQPSSSPVASPTATP